ncbi:MAG: hypothetical protein AB7V43_07445, partial [Acidimicrobiia bacterium]
DGRFSAKVFTTAVRGNLTSSAKALASAAWSQSLKGPIVNPDHPWRQRRRGVAPSGERPQSPLKVDVPSADARNAFVGSISAAN